MIINMSEIPNSDEYRATRIRELYNSLCNFIDGGLEAGLEIDLSLSTADKHNGKVRRYNITIKKKL